MAAWARSTRPSRKGGAMLVTADHGNAEKMIDPETGGPHTAHTTNPVPFIYIAEDAKQFLLRPNGSLQDISPTDARACWASRAQGDDGPGSAAAVEDFFFFFFFFFLKKKKN